MGGGGKSKTSGSEPSVVRTDGKFAIWMRQMDGVGPPPGTPDRMSWDEAVRVHQKHMGYFDETRGAWSIAFSLIGGFVNKAASVLGYAASIGKFDFEKQLDPNLDNPKLTDSQVQENWKRAVEWFGEGRVEAPERVMELGLGGYWGEKLFLSGEQIRDAIKADKEWGDQPPDPGEEFPPDEVRRSERGARPPEPGETFPPEEVRRTDWGAQPPEPGETFPPEEVRRTDWGAQPPEPGETFPPDEVRRSDWGAQPPEPGETFPPDEVHRSDRGAPPPGPNETFTPDLDFPDEPDDEPLEPPPDWNRK